MLEVSTALCRPFVSVDEKYSPHQGSAVCSVATQHRQPV
jgi:hypothetical protein